MVDKGEGEGFGDSTLSGLAQLSRIPVEVLDGTPVLCLHRQRLAWRFDSMGTAKVKLYLNEFQSKQPR